MSTLPAIPNKRYFTIGEVSTLCAVKPHVLRYWEQEFQVLRPSKRRGNRRYYRLEDVLVVRQIKSLLYDQGYTISGARNVIANPAPVTAPRHGEEVIPAEAIQNNPELPRHSVPRNDELIPQLEEVLSILSAK